MFKPNQNDCEPRSFKELSYQKSAVAFFCLDNGTLRRCRQRFEKPTYIEIVSKLSFIKNTRILSSTDSKIISFNNLINYNEEGG